MESKPAEVANSVVVGELRVTEGGTAVTELPLILDRGVRVGRESTNDLVLRSNDVSRSHALFYCTQEGVLLSDLGSRNGTFVNGERISAPTFLKNKDIVTIAQSELEVQIACPSKRSEPSTSLTNAIGLRVAQVTIFVADISSYTRMSESLPREDVGAMLDRWLTVTTDLIRRNGGFVDKYIGDAVMAVWQEGVGKGRSAKDHANAAAQTAIEALRLTALMNANEWRHRDTMPWRCKISLASGEALFGSMGTSAVREYTFVGDNVNLAFRLNDLANPLKQSLVISGGTANLLKEDYAVLPLGKHAVKGKADLVDVFTVGDSRC